MIKVPLLWSAAGHVLVLSACVALGMAAAGRELPAFVPVVLVEGFPAGTSPVVRQGSAGPYRVLGKTPGIMPSVKPGPPYAPGLSGTGDAPAAEPNALPVPPPAGAPGLSMPSPDAPVGPSVPGRRAGETGRALLVAATAPAYGVGTGPTASGAVGEPGDQRPLPRDDPKAGRTLSAFPAAAAGAEGGGGEGKVVRLLRERIESRIVYPEEARRRGQEGVVLLRIRVGEGGIPKDVRVAQSSGARVLDEAARTGVVRSAPLPSIPGLFEVPVRFLLR
ncbi:MAG: energy transducer TonB [Deltaproteobacteria bacterium]|nr:energy transducer TonB [Deltaproteobacteria bacterium]